MKEVKKCLLVIFMILILSACGKDGNVSVSEGIKNINLSGNLVTYQVYYHNVLEYEKEKDTGITHFLEKDRKLFAEYTATIRYGIDLTRVKIEEDGKSIKVFIPKAKMIGTPNVDKDDFKKENFIESKDGIINKNPITFDDISKAFDEAQEKMKQKGLEDSETLSLAQSRAKTLIEEKIMNLSEMDTKGYSIVWTLE